MTGPNPDAELDNALGINQLPPAVVTDEHRQRALRALFPTAKFRPSDVAELAEMAGWSWLVHRTAQAIADEGQRAVARYITEHTAAGTDDRHRT